MKSSLIEQERTTAKNKYKRELAILARKEAILDMMPDPIDKQFMPRIYIVTTQGLGHEANLTWGNWGTNSVTFKDTEVSMLMLQYPPIPMMLVEHGSKSFRPTNQETWDRLWTDNSIKHENNTIETRHPVSPFTFHMRWAEHGAQTTVEWFSKLEDTVVKCKVHLSPHKDPSYMRPVFLKDVRGYNTRAVAPKFEVNPYLNGSYQTISWWSPPPSERRTFYWWYPEEEDRIWGNIIDNEVRNEARE